MTSFLQKLARVQDNNSHDGDHPEDQTAPFQVLILQQPRADTKWWNFCKTLKIDMNKSHRICTDVAKNGVAVLGAWRKAECMDIERQLKDELEIECSCIPAPVDGGGVIAGTRAGAADAVADGTLSHDDGVNPEIQRLYDDGIISKAEYDQMIQAHKKFEEEIGIIDTTGRHADTEGGDKKGERIPDLYDAYASRLKPMAWVNYRLYKANAESMVGMCLVEFGRKFCVPRKGKDRGKIKYHRNGCIKGELKYSPEYSSDKNSEEYGKYCRFALVKYRPWIGSPFGDDMEGKERTPSEEECIKEWAAFLIALQPRMKYIPDLLLPDELKGNGASIDLLVVPEVEEEGFEEEEEEKDEKESELGEGLSLAEHDIGSQTKLLDETLDDCSSMARGQSRSPVSVQRTDEVDGGLVFEEVEKLMSNTSRESPQDSMHDEEDESDDNGMGSEISCLGDTQQSMREALEVAGSDFEYEEAQQAIAATAMQAQARRSIARQQYQTMQSSCVVLQSQARRLSERARYRRVIQSVTGIQALSRGARARRVLQVSKDMKASHEDDSSASLLQSGVVAGAGDVHSPFDAAKVDTEAHFLFMLNDDDSSSNKGSLSRDLEGIVVDQDQQLGLDGKKDSDAAATATATTGTVNSDNNTPQKVQKKSSAGGSKTISAASVNINSPTDCPASAADDANVATTSTTTTTMTPATTAGKATASAATAVAAPPDMANYKFNELNDKWERLSSPDPVETNAAGGAGGSEAAKSTPVAATAAAAAAAPSINTPVHQEMEMEAATQNDENNDSEKDDSSNWDKADLFGNSVNVSVSDVNLSVHADTASAACSLCKAAVGNANSVETHAHTTGKIDKHDFLSPDFHNYRSPPSNFVFDPPASFPTLGKPAADGEAKDKTKPLKPPHTNAKQGEIPRNKIASSSSFDVAASVDTASIARQQYQTMQSSCVVLQSQARGLSARARYRRVIQSVIGIQALLRGARARRVLQVSKDMKASHEEGSIAATLLQSVWRRYTAQEDFERQRAFCVSIQSAARGHSNRQSYLTLVKGCVAFQAVVRGSMVRKMQQREKDAKAHDTVPNALGIKRTASAKVDVGAGYEAIGGGKNESKIHSLFFEAETDGLYAELLEEEARTESMPSTESSRCVSGQRRSSRKKLKKVSANKHVASFSGVGRLKMVASALLKTKKVKNETKKQSEIERDLAEKEFKQILILSRRVPGENIAKACKSSQIHMSPIRPPLVWEDSFISMDNTVLADEAARLGQELGAESEQEEKEQEQMRGDNYAAESGEEDGTYGGVEVASNGVAAMEGDECCVEDTVVPESLAAAATLESDFDVAIFLSRTESLISEAESLLQTSHPGGGGHQRVPSYVTPLRAPDDKIMDTTTSDYSSSSHHHPHQPPTTSSYYGPSRPYIHIPYPPSLPPPQPPSSLRIFHPLAEDYAQAAQQQHSSQRRYFQEQSTATTEEENGKFVTAAARKAPFETRKDERDALSITSDPSIDDSVSGVSGASTTSAQLPGLFTAAALHDSTGSFPMSNFRRAAAVENTAYSNSSSTCNFIGTSLDEESFPASRFSCLEEIGFTRDSNTLSLDTQLPVSDTLFL